MKSKGSEYRKNKGKLIRCEWVTEDPIYIKYHDTEWGKQQNDNVRMFEMLCLEGQQAGLSWITILKKRENYRKLFQNFDPYKIAELNNIHIDRLLQDSSIIRHKGKIEAIINNAKCYIKMTEAGEDFSKFIWSFVDNKPIENNWTSGSEIPTETEISISLSKALKKRGFKYIGSTICYAFMQACGLVNDHILDCICKNQPI